jgi:cell division protein FtsB
VKINARLGEDVEVVRRRRERSPVWDGLKRVVQMSLVVLVAFGIYRVFGPNEDRLRELRREVTEKQDELRSAQRTRDAQAEQIRMLKTDPASVERAARDQLEFSRPGETIFRFEPYSATPKK